MFLINYLAYHKSEVNRNWTRVVFSFGISCLCLQNLYAVSFFWFIRTMKNLELSSFQKKKKKESMHWCLEKLPQFELAPETSNLMKKSWNKLSFLTLSMAGDHDSEWGNGAELCCHFCTGEPAGICSWRDFSYSFTLSVPISLLL